MEAHCQRLTSRYVPVRLYGVISAGAHLRYLTLLILLFFSWRSLVIVLVVARNWPARQTPPDQSSATPESRFVLVRKSHVYLSVLIACVPAPQSVLRSFVIAPPASRHRLVLNLPRRHAPPSCHCQWSLVRHWCASSPACTSGRDRARCVICRVGGPVSVGLHSSCCVWS